VRTIHLVTHQTQRKFLNESRRGGRALGASAA